MKIEIKSRYDSSKIIFSGAFSSIKKALEKAVNEGAYLRGAYLGGIKSYQNNHDIFIELIRRQKTKTFSLEIWGIIGQIAIQRICWGEIEKRFGKKILKVGKILAKQGFGEYLKSYEKQCSSVSRTQSPSQAISGLTIPR